MNFDAKYGRRTEQLTPLTKNVSHGTDNSAF